MKFIIQRVKHASVSIDDQVRGEIGQGLMILYGAKEGDALELIPKLAAKAANLRIFEDEAGKMNRSALEVGGGALVVPNFTLRTRKRATAPRLSRRRSPRLPGRRSRGSARRCGPIPSPRSAAVCSARTCSSSWPTTAR